MIPGMEARVFEQNRSRLTGIAYGMLGSVMEAEDVVQDAYLRWHAVEPSRVDSPAAYGQAIGIVTFEIRDGLVTAVRASLNPNKLTHVEWE